MPDEFVYFAQLREEIVFRSSAVSAFDLDEGPADAVFAAVGDEEVGPGDDRVSSPVQRDFGFDFDHVVFWDAEHFRVEEKVVFEFFVPLERPSL